MAYQAIDPSTEYGVFQRALRSGKGLDPVVSAVSAPIAQGIVRRVMAPEEARRKQEFAAARSQGALAGKGAEIAGQGRLQMQQAVGQLGTTAAALGAAELADYFNTKAQFDAALAQSPQEARKFLEANPTFDPGEAGLQAVIAGTDPNPGVSAAAFRNLQAGKDRAAFAAEANRIGTALKFEQMDPRNRLLEAMAADPQVVDRLAEFERKKELEAIKQRAEEQNAPGYGDLTLGEMSDPVGMDRTNIKDVQSMLKAQGFDPGAIDGIIGRMTRGQIAAFQESMGMPMTGTLDRDTLNALRTSMLQLNVGPAQYVPQIGPSPAQLQQGQVPLLQQRPIDIFPQGIGQQQLPPYMRPGV